MTTDFLRGSYSHNGVPVAGSLVANTQAPPPGISRQELARAMKWECLPMAPT